MWGWDFGNGKSLVPETELIPLRAKSCSKQTLKNINEDSKRVALFQFDVFQEIQTRKFPPPFKREKVRQSSYCLSEIPLRIFGGLRN